MDFATPDHPLTPCLLFTCCRDEDVENITSLTYSFKWVDWWLTHQLFLHEILSQSKVQKNWNQHNFHHLHVAQLVLQSWASINTLAFLWDIEKMYVNDEYDKSADSRCHKIRRIMFHGGETELSLNVFIIVVSLTHCIRGRFTHVIYWSLPPLLCLICLILPDSSSIITLVNFLSHLPWDILSCCWKLTCYITWGTFVLPAAILIQETCFKVFCQLYLRDSLKTQLPYLPEYSECFTSILPVLLWEVRLKWILLELPYLPHGCAGTFCNRNVTEDHCIITNFHVAFFLSQSLLCNRTVNKYFISPKRWLVMSVFFQSVSVSNMY